MSRMIREKLLEISSSTADTSTNSGKQDTKEDTTSKKDNGTLEEQVNKEHIEESCSNQRSGQDVNKTSRTNQPKKHLPHKSDKNEATNYEGDDPWPTRSDEEGPIQFSRNYYQDTTPRWFRKGQEEDRTRQEIGLQASIQHREKKLNNYAEVRNKEKVHNNELSPEALKEKNRKKLKVSRKRERNLKRNQQEINLNERCDQIQDSLVKLTIDLKRAGISSLEFCCDDFPPSKWVPYFEETADRLLWNTTKKFFYSKLLLTGRTKDLLETETKIKSWNVLKEKLLQMEDVGVSGQTGRSFHNQSDIDTSAPEEDADEGKSVEVPGKDEKDSGGVQEVNNERNSDQIGNVSNPGSEESEDELRRKDKNWGRMQKRRNMKKKEVSEKETREERYKRKENKRNCIPSVYLC